MTAWPLLSVPDGALLDRGCWRLAVRLQNAQSLPVHGGTIEVKIVGSDTAAGGAFPRIEPGHHTSVDVTIPGENIPEGTSLAIEATIRQRAPRGGEEKERIDRYQVARSKQLVERTVEQAEFEEMF